MRKKNQTKLFDNILWYTIYLLPIIITIVVMAGWIKGYTFTYPSPSMDDEPIWSCFRMVLRGLGFTQNNLLFIWLRDISSLGNVEWIQPISSIVTYFSYFISMHLLHLFVDFILFIPRLCHKWLSKFTQED